MKNVFLDTNILIDFFSNRQCQCAIAGGCEVIITNNKKDFAEYSKLPLFTAAEYISII